VYYSSEKLDLEQNHVYYNACSMVQCAHPADCKNSAASQDAATGVAPCNRCKIHCLACDKHSNPRVALRESTTGTEDTCILSDLCCLQAHRRPMKAVNVMSPSRQEAVSGRQLHRSDAIYATLLTLFL